MLSDNKILLVHLDDGTLKIFELSQDDSLSKADPKLSPHLLLSMKSTFLQIERATDKRDLFVIYDNVDHFLYWCMIDPANLKKLAAEKSITEDKADLWKVFSVKVKCKMILKRFDYFRLFGRHIVMLSEFWDCWLFSFD